ncbi:hypothetical protein NDU88_004872 [Pleurodeles waltl]|uniref:Uncharacterized protein n=1 Tax=Pleurodeles waltl TaxID=8319 RepID=A0AAV7T9C1_PLEWA|nr:hypothetical protein NDU88_004872 [Pleurodeles waltl]
MVNASTSKTFFNIVLISLILLFVACTLRVVFASRISLGNQNLLYLFRILFHGFDASTSSKISNQLPPGRCFRLDSCSTHYFLCTVFARPGNTAPKLIAATASAAFVRTAFARSRAKKREQPSWAQPLRDLKLLIQLETRPIDFKVARLPKSANPRPIVGDTSQLRSLPGTDEKTLATKKKTSS